VAVLARDRFFAALSVKYGAGYYHVSSVAELRELTAYIHLVVGRVEDDDDNDATSRACAVDAMCAKRLGPS
jgi:hypothetical protein